MKHMTCIWRGTEECARHILLPCLPLTAVQRTKSLLKTKCWVSIRDVIVANRMPIWQSYRTWRINYMWSRTFLISVDAISFFTSNTDQDPMSLAVLKTANKHLNYCCWQGERRWGFFPRRWRANWDIIQTNNPLTQAFVSVYAGEVRVSIPFKLASVIYSPPTMGRGYWDESHKDRASTQCSRGETL